MGRDEARGGRAPAIRFGFTEFALFGDALPATAEDAFAVLPTYKPEGKSPLLFFSEPADPLASAFPLPALAPAAPEAP
jgi:hypothetical protein